MGGGRPVACISYTAVVVSYPVDQIFDRQSFASHAQKVKEEIRKEVATQIARDVAPISSRYRDRTEIAKGHAVTVPRITTKEARVRGEKVEYVINFDAPDGTFFRFSPTNRPAAEQPRGQVLADCIIMNVPNTRDAAKIKAELAGKYAELTEWYEALAAEVSELNQSLPAEIDRIIRECEDAERAERELEAELNG